VWFVPDGAVGPTPLSVFLGTLGFRVANCPVVAGQELPAAVEHVDRRRIFGMTVEPDVLTAYRQVSGGGGGGWGG